MRAALTALAFVPPASSRPHQCHHGHIIPQFGPLVPFSVIGMRLIYDDYFFPPCRFAMSESRHRTMLFLLSSNAIAAAVLCPLAAAFLVPDLCVGPRVCTRMKLMRRPPMFALRLPRLPAQSIRRQAIGITGGESCHGQDDPRSDGQIDDKIIRANRLPNLSRAQDLNELLAMVRPFTASAHGAPALEGWEAALVMNRVSRLMKRPRLSVTTDRSAAFALLSRLVGVVINRGGVLKPKGFAWALNACDSLPRRATSAAPSAKGYVANIGTRTNSSTSYATRDEALLALVPVMLAQLSRFGDADEGVAPQNLAIFTSALAQLATAGVGLPEESRAHVQLLSTLALDQVFRQVCFVCRNSFLVCCESHLCTRASFWKRHVTRDGLYSGRGGMGGRWPCAGFICQRSFARA